MLVLSRRKGETLRVGNAVITLLAVGGNRARIGIEAPQEVHVLRGELHAKDRVSNAAHDDNSRTHFDKETFDASEPRFSS